MLFVSTRAPAAGAATANILGHEESDREHRGNRELHTALELSTGNKHSRSFTVPGERPYTRS